MEEGSRHAHAHAHAHVHAHARTHMYTHTHKHTHKHTHTHTHAHAHVPLVGLGNCLGTVNSVPSVPTELLSESVGKDIVTKGLFVEVNCTKDCMLVK